MNTTVIDLSTPSGGQTSLAISASSDLENRFILTQVEQLTLVFPATWVAEILRIDRAQILDLPFYDPLLVGIANSNGQITPLIAAARLLEVENFALSERSIVVKLNQAAGELGNVGLIVDRAIGTSNREELHPNLFTTERYGAMVLMRNHLVPAKLWQPQYWSSNN